MTTTKSQIIIDTIINGAHYDTLYTTSNNINIPHGKLNINNTNSKLTNDVVTLDFDFPCVNGGIGFKYSIKISGVHIMPKSLNLKQFEEFKSDQDSKIFNDMNKSFLSNYDGSNEIKLDQPDLTELEDEYYSEVELDESECMTMNDNFFDVALGRVDPINTDVRYEISNTNNTKLPNRSKLEKEKSDNFIKPLYSLTTAPKSSSPTLHSEPEHMESDPDQYDDDYLQSPAAPRRGRPLKVQDGIKQPPSKTGRPSTYKKKIRDVDDEVVEPEPKITKKQLKEQLKMKEKEAKLEAKLGNKREDGIASSLVDMLVAAADDGTPERSQQSQGVVPVVEVPVKVKEVSPPTFVSVYRQYGIDPPSNMAILATEAPLIVLLERGFPPQMLQRLSNIPPGHAGSSIAPSLVVPEVVSIFGMDYKYKMQEPLFDPNSIPYHTLHLKKRFPLAPDVCAGCLGALTEVEDHQFCNGNCLRTWHVSCKPLLSETLNSALTWKCPDCITQVYGCFVCKVISRAGEQIYPCSEGCGCYYHPGCMELWFQAQVPLEVWRNRSTSCHSFHSPHVKKNLIPLPSVSLDPRNGTYGPCPRHFCHGCGYRLPISEMTCCIACPQVFPRSHICSTEKQNTILQISKTFFVCRLHPELQTVLKQRFLAVKQQLEKANQIEQLPEKREQYQDLNMEQSEKIQIEDEVTQSNQKELKSLPHYINLDENVEIIPNEASFIE